MTNQQKPDEQVSIQERWAADDKLADGNDTFQVHALPRWRRDKLSGYGGQEQPTMFDDSKE